MTATVDSSAAQLNFDVECSAFIEINTERNNPVKRLGGKNDQGPWDADANGPDLSAITPSAGDYYTVSVAGTTGFAGRNLWKVGDVVVFDGTQWKPGDAPRNIFTLLKAAVKAVLAYRGVKANPNDLFALAPQEPITLDSFDPGLLCYHVVFTKRCVL